MLHPCQVAAPFQVLNARNEIAFFFVPFDGTLKRVDLAVKPANANANGDAAFDVKLNGASIFGSPADRPKILSGAAKGYVSALTVAVTEGDVISFDAATIPAGGFQGPVMLQCLIDDDITPGLDAAAVNALIAAFGPGGDLAGTLGAAIVNQIKGRSLGGIPTTGGFVGDDFNDNALSTDWTTGYGGGSALEQNQRLELHSTGGNIGIEGVAADFRSKSAQISVASIAGISGDGAGYGTSFNAYWALMPGAVHDLIDGTYSSASFFVYGHAGAYRLKGHHYRLGTAYDTIFDIAFDPVAHKYWRLRHSANTMFWDTSPDGAAWTNQGSASTTQTASVDLSAARPIFVVQAGVDFFFDNYVTDVPLADPITASDYLPLSWVEAHHQFELVRTFGMIDILVGAPSGPPSGWPAGKGWIGCLGNTMYMWDGSAMHSQVF